MKLRRPSTAQLIQLKGESETDSGRHEIVFWSIDEIVTGVREHSNVRREAVFKANASIPEHLIVRIAAIQMVLASDGSDPG
jgi:hypothetical protein